jgi:uncharacterized membrane protein
MEKNRLEAFSDGVIAVIITIMVLEMKVPHGAELAALAPLFPVAVSYVLSYLMVGIYWNNHHHMLQASTHVNGAVLWGNLLLLFWLSLLPFTTGWMGENHFALWPTTVYGVNLLACALAYTNLQVRLINRHGGRSSVLARAIGRDIKGLASLALYIAGIALTWLVAPWAGVTTFFVVGILWLIPDRRMERIVAGRESDKP